MRLIRNKRAVALRAHSVKFWALSVLCLLGVVGDSWALFQGLLPVRHWPSQCLALCLASAGLAGRFIDQDL